MKGGHLLASIVLACSFSWAPAPNSTLSSSKIQNKKQLYTTPETLRMHINWCVDLSLPQEALKFVQIQAYHLNHLDI